MKTIQPLNDNVAIKLHEEKDISPGGIHLPNSAKKKSKVGTVFAIGSSVEKSLIKCGDTVIIAEYSGVELDVGDFKVTIVDVKDILVRLA